MQKITPELILTRMKEILQDEKSWMKGNYAETASGRECLGGDPDAVRFCLLGCEHHVLRQLEYGSSYDLIDASRQVEDRLDRLARARGHGGVISFNDDPSTTHKDVMGLLEEGSLHVTG